MGFRCETGHEDGGQRRHFLGAAGAQFEGPAGGMGMGGRAGLPREYLPVLKGVFQSVCGLFRLPDDFAVFPNDFLGVPNALLPIPDDFFPVSGDFVVVPDAG